MRCGALTISDRATSGVYEDRSGPAIVGEIEKWFEPAVEWHRTVIPDETERIVAELQRMCDVEDCWLVLTTGGTGPAPRDVTPEATRVVLERELPGIAEAIRLSNFPRIPTAILSRAVAGIRGRSLVVNLPGNPRAIGESLPFLVGAIAEAVDHLRGERPALRRKPVLVQE